MGARTERWSQPQVTSSDSRAGPDSNSAMKATAFGRIAADPEGLVAEVPQGGEHRLGLGQVDDWLC